MLVLQLDATLKYLLRRCHYFLLESYGPQGPLTLLHLLVTIDRILIDASRRDQLLWPYLGAGLVTK